MGTNRYISPEILGEQFFDSEFKCYKQADVYSFGLVLWELCRRTIKDVSHKQKFVNKFDFTLTIVTGRL